MGDSSTNDFWKKMGVDPDEGVSKYRPKVIVASIVQLLVAAPLIVSLFAGDFLLYVVGIAMFGALSLFHLLGLIGALASIPILVRIYKYLMSFAISVIELCGLGILGFNMYQCFTPDGKHHYLCQSANQTYGWVFIGRFAFALVLSVLTIPSIRNYSKYCAIKSQQENEMANI